MRHGWFKIPGRQGGDRTLAEQRTGVEKALFECKGKTVLDLGCAEGLLSLEFAIHGAQLVHGIDALGDHLTVAQEVCLLHRNISFEQMDLNYPLDLNRRFDIVLALGVAHKLLEPAMGIRYAAAHAGDLILVRMTRYADRVLKSKFNSNECDVGEELSTFGFALECVEPGPRQETVHYFRRREH